jgi:hypothetical protein
MPGPEDQDVYLAMLQLLKHRGGMLEDGHLAFSLYELRKVLGSSDDLGDAYREIQRPPCLDSGSPPSTSPRFCSPARDS